MGLGSKVIWALAVGSGIVQAESAMSLTVLLYDFANVPSAKLSDAKAFAARSYRAAGIELTWLECATSQIDAKRFRACEQANVGTRLFLKIIPEKMDAGVPRPRESEDTLGIAFIYYAYVLYPRVRELANVWELPEYVVLGRTMAHELGHLLLGPNSHSASGLMRPHFRRQDLTLESGQFLFDPKQAAQLRKLSVRNP